MEIITENVVLLIVSLFFITIIILTLVNKLHEIKDCKLHIFYISFILSLTIIALVTYICIGSYKHDEILEYISFAGTLSSLILSVVAIIFTIVLSKAGNEQIVKMNEAIIAFKETVGDFQKKSNQLDDIITKLEKIENNTVETNDFIGKLKDDIHLDNNNSIVSSPINKVEEKVS